MHERCVVFRAVLALVSGFDDRRRAARTHPHAALAARRTVRQHALTGFIAVCLLGGYGWLALSGVLGLAGALMPDHPWHDAALRALTLGFVFSMVLGHAPVIVPALTRLRVKYHPFFYAPLAVLHAGLAMRLTGGLAERFWLRKAGGIAGAVALALFALTLMIAVLAVRRARARRTGGRPLSNPPPPRC
ncbi:hypothetical protein C7410_106170 [Paraburkholderia silvatlantica]|uniref:NnrS protein n=1 Tax=Paraburkholderia silvatlantica TaxID=321895 RepID=A0A2V4U828_9BURK|nr:hypothetical protein [Paraburkholderia silvatlantica]PYE24340.1 hypothetical protein C7410_106170 [Paraburkholderia silvatlantica]